MVGVALQHGSIVESFVIVVTGYVIAIMRNLDINVVYAVNEIANLAYPGIGELMWTKVSKKFKPFSGHDGKDGIGMAIVGGHAQDSELFDFGYA